MNIVLLGPKRPEMIDFLKSYGDRVENTEELLTPDLSILQEIDFLISYGYRHILKGDLLKKFPATAINFHISFLPWNRGADPNLWSFLEDTPNGVTIHYLDAGIDSGDILAQQLVSYQPDDTLRTTYERLSRTIERLFREVWCHIREGRQPSFPQPEGGSSHRVRDRARYEHLLVKGWDTPVAKLVGKALVDSHDKH